MHQNLIGQIILQQMLLLGYRSDTESWGIIGGGLKIDESLKSGIIREVRGETSILIVESHMPIMDYLCQIIEEYRPIECESRI